MLFVCFIWSFLVYFSLNKKIEDFFYIAPFLILAIILLALISEEKEIEINSLNFNSGDKIIIRDAGLNVHRKRYYLILLNYSSSMTGDATFYNEEFLYQEELLSSNGFYLLNFPEFKISEMGCSHSNSKDLTWVISMDDGRSFHYFKINASTC